MEDSINTGAKIVETTPLGACLIPLLKVLGWHGTHRQLVESMPHFSQIENAAMFRDVMQRLDYSAATVRVDLNDFDERLLPCLFVSDTGATVLLLRREGEKYITYDGEMEQESTLPIEKNDPALIGTANIFKKNKPEGQRLELEEVWLRKTFRTNKNLIITTLVLSFFINLFALATPLFIMATYDKVVGTSSRLMLGEFVIGIGLAFSGYYILYKIRAKLLAVIGARFDRAIGNNIFERLLYLAPVYTESATVGSQVARIKNFDRLRQFLTGPLMVTLFDLPFIFVSLAIIAIIAGNLVVIPFVMIIVFLLIGIILRLKVRRRIAESGLTSSKEQEFVLEAVKSVKTIKELSGERTWEQRFRDYSAGMGMATIKMTMLNATTSAIADFMMIASGMAILSFGAIKVINQTLTVGGMIAVMILIWRALGPLKTLFNALPRIQQVESSIRQITRLMQIEREAVPQESYATAHRQVQGKVTFDRVSLRHRVSYEPALMGVTFQAQPGELVGIVGRNGSGKSTVLKVLLGLYQPQAGSVRIDNQDIRQINPIELRSMIAYLPQYPELFYGSIAANLRLAAPNATDKEVEQACAMTGVLNDIKALPDGFLTPLKDYSTGRLPISFQQGLCLARAYLKKARVILMDEPGNMLDRDADQRLMKTLEYLRGKATVIMVTHRPSHLKLMDKILLLEKGQLVLQGPTDEVLPKIPKEFL